MLKSFFYLLTILLLTNCTNFSNRYGPYVMVEKINLGDSKAKVQEEIGPPSYYSPTDNNKWCYISTTVNRSIPFPSYSTKIVEITFDENDNVTNLSEVDKEKQPLPSFNRSTTTGKGIYRTQSLAEQIVNTFKSLRPQPSLPPSS